MAEREVTERTSDEITDEGERVRQRTVTTSSSEDTKNTAVNAVWYIFGFIAILLGIRFVLKLFGANPANGFVDLVYSVTGVLSAPFDTIFGVASTEAGSVRSTFEPSILVAIAVYALIAWGVTKLLKLNDK